MITIRKKLAPTWFDISEDQDSPGFLLAPLTSAGWIDVRNELTQTPQGQMTITGRGAVSAAKACVLDWRNVVDESGQQLKFRRDLLEDLPRDVLLPIAGEIVERAQLSESERKNS